MNTITVASLACPGDGEIDSAIKKAGEMVLAACLDQPDLICLPEIFAWSSLSSQEKRESAQTVDGSVCTSMAELAADCKVNMLVPLLEKDGEKIYNSLVWLDRQGSVLGVYRKVFLPIAEIDGGFHPGDQNIKVFDTEFGPIGACICFDLNYQQLIATIASQNAKLVIFPTMFQGLTLMQAWSKLYRMYFVSVAESPYAAAVNPLGNKLVKPWHHSPIMTTTLNLDYVVLHTDQNTAKFLDIKKAYGRLIAIDHAYIESCALLTSNHPDKTAIEIAVEFDMELESEYLTRTQQICEKKRSTQKG